MDEKIMQNISVTTGSGGAWGSVNVPYHEPPSIPAISLRKTEDDEIPKHYQQLNCREQEGTGLVTALDQNQDVEAKVCCQSEWISCPSLSGKGWEGLLKPLSSRNANAAKIKAASLFRNYFMDNNRFCLDTR